MDIYTIDKDQKISPIWGHLLQFMDNLPSPCHLWHHVVVGHVCDVTSAKCRRQHGCRDFDPKWVRKALNGNCLRLLKIIFSTFWFDKIPRFVSLSANLTHLGQNLTSRVDRTVQGWLFWPGAKCTEI